MTRMPLAAQRGVAIITALMLTALAVTIVTSLFWQQQVQVRSIENQRLHLQARWILRGALDWARLVLREDGKFTSVDTLDEPWSVTLEQTRLDQYVENGRGGSDQSDATLSGRIVDGQARFNLANLAQNGTVNTREVAIFARLLNSLQLNSALAQAVADVIAHAQQPVAAGSVPAAAGAQSARQLLALSQLDDLLAVPGFDAAMLATLRDFVVLLPHSTLLNVNTASARVLAARIATLSEADAAALVAAREKAYFLSGADFIARLPQGKTNDISANEIAVATNYFIVYGTVHLNRARMDMQALIERNAGSTKLLWVRDN